MLCETLQYLKHCDEIMVIQEGKIAERGKHEDLMVHEGYYGSMISQFHASTSYTAATGNKIMGLNNWELLQCTKLRPIRLSSGRQFIIGYVVWEWHNIQHIHCDITSVIIRLIVTSQQNNNEMPSCQQWVAERIWWDRLYLFRL